MEKKLEKLHKLIDILFKRVELLESEVVRKGKRAIFAEKRCELTKVYYESKKYFKGKQGTIVGESKDKKEWKIRWDGLSEKTIYNHPKEGIKILRSKEELPPNTKE